MLRLAVTTNAETFDRMRRPLADRNIAAEHLPAKGRTFDLITPPTQQFDVGFVYPSRIFEGAVIDAQYEIPWVNDRAAVLTSRNKAGVIAALNAAGISVPDTLIVSNPTSPAAIRETIAESTLSYPIVIKPNSTTRGIGIAKLEDEDSLFGVIDYLNLLHDFNATGDKSFLLQEYLPDAKDYRVMILDGEYAGAVERQLPESKRRDGRWKHNVHRGADASGVDLPPSHRQIAEQVAEHLSIPYLGVDLLVTEDRVVVSETNARPTIDTATKYDPGFYDHLASLIERTANQK